jgi:hypothetical protein
MTANDYEARTAREQAEQTTIRERWTRTMLQLPEALNAREQDAGSRWRLIERDGDRATLRNDAYDPNAQPEQIVLSLNVYDRRITAYGRYGQSLDGRQWVPSYNIGREAADPQPSMSADKTPAQIAADLCRRLLPKYREYLAVYRRQLAAAVERRAQTHTLAASLIEASGGRLKRWGRAWEEKDPQSLSAHVEYQSIAGVSYGEIEVSSGSSVHVKLTVDVERARQLMAWLAQQPTGTPSAG